MTGVSRFDISFKAVFGSHEIETLALISVPVAHTNAEILSQ